MDYEPRQDDRIEQAAQMSRVLSVETRIHILALLRERKLCVGALAQRLRLTQGAVSQHLKILREAGLVAAERDGYYVHYRVDGQALAQWQRALDVLLEWLQAERTNGDVAEDAASTGCKRREENACARTKPKAVAERGAT